MKTRFRQLTDTAGDAAQRLSEAGKSLVVAASNTSGGAARAASSSLQSGLAKAKINAADATHSAGKTVRTVADKVGDKAVMLGESGKSLAAAASNTTGQVARTAASSVQNGLATVKINVVDATHVAGKAARVAGSVAGAVGASAARTASTIGTTLLDQNGDGQLDQADVKIATEKAASAVKAIAAEVASSNLAKDAATGAAIGAVIALPIPLVGSAVGATVGATVGVIASLRKKK